MTTVPPFRPVVTPSQNGMDTLVPPTDPVPDHRATANDKPVGPPIVPPIPAKKAAGKPGGLGTNRPPKTARKLTEEDREKLENYYISIAIPVSMFSKDVGNVIAANAKDCADAWFKLADENASVRRAILAMMEGSAWAGILVAHLPILLVALPQSITANNPILGPIQAMTNADAAQKLTNGGGDE